MQDKPVYILQKMIMKKQFGLPPSSYRALISVKNHRPFYALHDPAGDSAKACYPLNVNSA